VAKKKDSGPQCEQCGKPLKTKRSGRKRRYCSSRCRSAARRYRGWGANFVSRGYPTEAKLQNGSEKSTISAPSQGEKRDLAFPIDVLGGGNRWPWRLDRGLLRTIIEREIGGRVIRAGDPSSSSTGSPTANDNLTIMRKRAA
jgi:hypothetical protein